jgi:predicted regulator of Ras-like GTPase activity (Roadblock/LC7/MglB family)
MKIPFLGFFKKSKSAEPAPIPVGVVPAPIDKPSSARMSKTVRPNANRTFTPQTTAPAPVPTPAPLVNPPAPSPVASGFAPRTVSLGGGIGLPHAARPSMPTPKSAERTVALELADILPQLPEGLINPSAVAPGSRLSFNAAEVERGMATGRPSASLASIYQQMPEIFAQAVGADDQRQVLLPFGKVLTQFTNLQVRPDQMNDEAVPQVETPFLQVTIEDDQRFGTSNRILRTSEMPSIRVEPATAATFAAAEPEPAIQETAPIRLSVPKLSVPAPVPAPPPAPIKLWDNSLAPAETKPSPNGTDVPATESVPASAGPSVPTSLPVLNGAPARIPFKITAPSDDLRAQNESASAASASLPEPPAHPEKSGVSISLSLRKIFDALPEFQLRGDVKSVAESDRIELPFSIVEPQLALGRVAVSPRQFASALPEKYRDLFDGSQADVPVALPLQEVLQNLPGASLRLRDDQVEQEMGEAFETPFSQKAKEDAARFNVADQPIARPSSDEIKTAPAVPVTEVRERSALQAALDTDDTLDAKGVVAHASRLPGVSACAIMFSDGLSLAGNLPAEFEADGLCAMAPSLLQRIDDHMLQTKLGRVNGVTVFCSKSPVSFFKHDNICLAALHSAGEIAGEIRERLVRTAAELALMYSQPTAKGA